MFNPLAAAMALGHLTSCVQLGFTHLVGLDHFGSESTVCLFLGPSSRSEVSFIGVSSLTPGQDLLK